MIIVEILDMETGQICCYADKCEWHGPFIWEEGNYSCDCNRYLFFHRCIGEDPDLDDSECGDERFLLAIYDMYGEELYMDSEWKTLKNRNGRNK